MKIIDLHCDTIMRFHDGEHLREMPDAHINLEKLKKGGCLAQCFAIFVPSHDAAKRNGNEEPQVYYDKAYAAYLREMELCKDEILPAYTVADVLANDANGKMSSILTVEDGVTIDGKLENIDKMFSDGVRMVALTWNYENSLGFPQSTEPEKHALGLKPFGIEAVRRMNELGIAVDTSHLSEGGFWDVVKHTSKPFIASHSCARALVDHSRDLTDEQLRALGDKGGMVGINYLTAFLRPVSSREDNYTSIELVAKHLLHMANVAGIESVGLGSDYDGMRSRMEWGDYGGYQVLVEGLEKYFSASDLEKICYKNALRVFRDIIGK